MYTDGGTAPKDQTVQRSAVSDSQLATLDFFFQPSYSPRHMPWSTQPPILSGTANDQ